MGWNIGTIAAYIFGILLLLLAARLFALPLKILLRLVYSTLIGGFALFVVNLIGESFQYHIPLNIVTACMAGFLGVPGFLLLAALKVILKI